VLQRFRCQETAPHGSHQEKETNDGSCVEVLLLFAKYCSTRVKGNFLHMPNTCIAQEADYLPNAKAVYCRRINEAIYEVQMVLYIDRHVSNVVTETLYPNIPPQQLVYGPPPSLVSTLDSSVGQLIFFTFSGLPCQF